MKKNNQFIKEITFLFLFSFMACNAKPNTETKEQKILTFLGFIKAKQYDKAKSMMSHISYISNSQQMVYDIERSTDFLIKYSIPTYDKWIITYDTSSSLVKIETYTLSLFKGFDSTNNLEESYVRISFDYTSHYIGDSIFHYELYTKKRHKPYYIEGQ